MKDMLVIYYYHLEGDPPLKLSKHLKAAGHPEKDTYKSLKEHFSKHVKGGIIDCIMLEVEEE